jgi:hypothetical protein
MRWLCVVGLASAACGSPGGYGSAIDAAVGSWSTLIERTWTLPPFTETHLCRRVQLPADLMIAGFMMTAPPGTHHTVLTLSPGGTRTGDYECAAQNLDPALLFAGGIGTGDLAFPPGVAIKLEAGQYVTLNLHLINRGDTPVTATSSVEVKTIPASAVVHEADMMFAGTTEIAVPGNNQPYSVVGGCIAPMEWRVFTLWPHMHAYATRQQVRVRRTSNDVEGLLDTFYSFDEQRNYPMTTEKLIGAGDQIEVVCTYQNDSGSTVYYGDGAGDEMCFAGMYKYPAGGQTTGCVEMP